MKRKQYEVLNRASLFLEKHHREPRVAEILLQHHLNVTRSEYYTMMQEEIPASIIHNFQADIKQHAESGIPVQHLTGHESFYGRNYAVDKHVLIPRPETEELVQHVIEKAGPRPKTVVDIGTGSGAIAITLALELPNTTIYATDISEKALNIAQKNAQQLNAKVNFLQGDFLQPLIDSNIHVDIIVSNPPYVAKEEAAFLSDTVRNFDPAIALFADENGLAAYKNIISQSPKVVKPNTIIAFEIGHKQSDAVHSLIKAMFPASDIETIQDINGKDRIVTACVTLLAAK